MSRPLFTPEELEELARIDAELEAAPMTADELADSRRRDRAAKLDSMDKRTRRVAEWMRQYYEAHRKEIAEKQRQYREAHREEIAERQWQYREAHREEIAERQRRYYEAHREEIAEQKRRYYETFYYADRPAQDGIRARRKALRISQAELAHRVGVSQPLICMIEKGRCGVAPQTMRVIEETLEEMEGAMT